MTIPLVCSTRLKSVHRWGLRFFHTTPVLNSALALNSVCQGVGWIEYGTANLEVKENADWFCCRRCINSPLHIAQVRGNNPAQLKSRPIDWMSNIRIIAKNSSPTLTFFRLEYFVRALKPDGVQVSPLTFYSRAPMLHLLITSVSPAVFRR